MDTLHKGDNDDIIIIIIIMAANNIPLTGTLPLVLRH